jgi:hypothetical protein
MSQATSNRSNFAEGVTWMDRHQPNNEEQRRFRMEADELMKQK